jgi:DNA/RNA-binding domain of Phe-tRNA-synthetase-like protein
MATLELLVDPHPLLDLAAFSSVFPAPLGSSAPPAWVTEGLLRDASAPLASDEAVRSAVRALLRHGGYKPSGRSKPASEYLMRAAERDALTSINLAVDVCNVVCLHSGLPISVIDVDRARPPFRVGIAPAGSRYVFNSSGQEIDLAGLLCLHDAEGPCANAVKDAQRTKTGHETMRTLFLIWGSLELVGRTERAATWAIEWLQRAGANVERIR